MSIPAIVSKGRDLIRTTFLDRCIIADRSEIRDSRGGKKSVWVDRTAPNICRFVALTDDVPKVEGASEFGVPTAVWLAPLGTLVREGDRITNLGYSGRWTGKWIVTNLLTPPSALAVSERVGIRQADKGEAE